MTRAFRQPEDYVTEAREIYRDLIEESLLLEGIQGMHVCVTGTLSRPRTEFWRMIEDSGGIVDKGVNKNTNLLILGSDIGRNKIAKAESLGVKTITEREFLHMVRGGRPASKEVSAWRGSGRGTTERVGQTMARLREPTYLDLVGESKRLLAHLIREALEDEDIPGFGRDS